MRRTQLCLLVALFALGGCSFDTSGPGFQGSASSTPDGPPADWTQADIGPRPDNGGPLDGPVKEDQTAPDLVPPKDMGPPCDGKMYACKGDDSQVCKGGTYTLLETCAMGCDTASGRCTKFKTLNGASSYLDKGTGKWTVTGTVKLDTTTGTFTPPQLTSAVGVHLAVNLRVLSVASMEVAAKGVLKVTGNLPLLIVARDSITITGDLDASADGIVPGPGGAAGGSSGKDGSGCGGGPKADSVSGLGGAGGSHGGLGGMGGTAKPKAACGQTCAVPLVGGSGGGDGDGHDGRGGAGGGGLQLTAGRAINIAGFINAGGGGGNRGKRADIAVDIITGSGGGGGSGGGIILEAPVIKVDGVVAANGGGGGGGAAPAIDHGGHGADGAAAIKAAKGGAAGLALSAGAGGDGSDETNLDGGGSITGLFTSGGGGGGAGRICVRSKTSFYSGKGKISPAPGSGAGALQKLVAVAP